MSENAGEYNRKIEIQKRSGAVDGSGQPLDEWITAHRLWSKIRGETGMATIRQAAAAQGIMVTTTRVSFRIRYRTDIDEAMRVVYRGVAYDILRVQSDDAGREWTDLVCEEGANAG
ncbi:head-tail joining protein [Stenotrophomonas phage Silvanus]|nr:head-tail joining protein [Stenotrophomonas phage Silvanus]